MGANTKIEWTSTRHPDGTVTHGYSFNAWWGCTKVSEECQHCYRVGKHAAGRLLDGRTYDAIPEVPVHG